MKHQAPTLYPSRRLTAKTLILLVHFMTLHCLTLVGRQTGPPDTLAGNKQFARADSLYQAEAYDSAFHYYQVAWAYHDRNGDCKETVLAKAGAALMTGLLGQTSLAEAQLIELEQTAVCCTGNETALQAHIRQNLALIYNREREFDRALHYLQMALKGFTEAYGDRHPTSIRALVLLGDTYAQMEQFKKADSLFQKGLELYGPLPGSDPVLLGKIHLSLGNNYYYLENYQKSQKHHRQALVLFQKYLPENHPSIAKALFYLGQSFEIFGEYDRAMGHYHQALDKQNLVFGHNSLAVTKTLRRIAGIHYYKNQFQKAKDYSLIVLDILQCLEIKENTALVQILNTLGIMDEKLGLPDCSLDYYQEALQILQAMKNPPDERIEMINNNISLAYLKLKNYDQSLNYLEKSFQTLKKLYDENHFDFGICYMNFGNIYINQKQYALAEANLRKALEIFLEKLGSGHPEIGHCFYLLGISCQGMELYDQAFDYYQKALSIYRSHFREEHQGTAIVYNCLGKFYEAKNQYDSALYYFMKVIAIKKKIFGIDHSELALSYHNIGDTYMRFGLPENALNYFQLAIQLQKEAFGPKHPLMAGFYNALGTAYFKKSDYRQSLQAYEQALSGNIVNEQVDPDSLWIDPENYWDGYELLRSLIGKTLTLSKLGADRSIIVKTLMQCDRLIGQLRQSNYLENDKIQLGRVAADVYEQAIGLCLENHQEGDALLQLAFYFSERNKGMVLFSSLKEQSAQKYATIPEALLESERNFKQEQYRLRQLLANTTDSLQKQEYRDQLFQAITGHRQLIDYLEKSYPDYYRLKYQEKITSPEEIQESLGPDEALIEYFSGDSSLFVFTLTDQGLWADTLSNTGSFDRALREFQHQLHTRPDMEAPAIGAYIEPATNLYALLMEGPLSHLSPDIRSLIIVPDGTLARLNFGALVRPEAHHQAITGFSQLPYLIKDFRVHYTASANLWMEAIEQTGKAPANDQARYAFGGFAPAYDSLLPEDETWPQMLASLVRAGEVRLPGAQKEVREIAEIMDGDAWLGAKATKTRFQAKAPEYRVLHLAMHALLDDQEPLNSCLVFSPPSTAREIERDTASLNPETDYLLYASDIYSMQLPNRMAVLSACNSGSGKAEKGEGIMSLSRAFMYAGCPTQTISLWNVSDLASSVIMVRFYENLAEGQPVDASLRNAQLHYLTNSGHPVFSHPYYWASFITIGDSSPIEFPRNHLVTFILVGIGVMVVTGLIIVLVPGKQPKLMAGKKRIYPIKQRDKSTEDPKNVK